MPVAFPRDEQEGEGDMFELRGRGNGDPVRPLLGFYLTRGTLALLNYFGKSDPEQLFLPWSSWELPPVARNGGI